jgi:hypothetical protein
MTQKNKNMTKEDFINLLKHHAEKAGVFRGRFVQYSENEDSWSYVRPAVDCFEPTISLVKEGYVLYWNMEKNPVEYTYVEFAKLYYLI